MSVNGVQIFTRAYNAASTAASPARFEIKIAEPNQMAACNLTLYKDTTKAVQGVLDLIQYSTAAMAGAYADFNPATGYLTLDAGLVPSSSVVDHHFNFFDLTAPNNGYICFTASKLAQAVAIPKTNPVAIIKDVKSAGTEGGTATAGAWYDRTLNTIENP